jgi:hypothetical protein
LFTIVFKRHCPVRTFVFTEQLLSRSPFAGIMVQYSAIGFIGLGTIGYPMAENLIKKIHPLVKLYVFDVSEDVVRKFVAARVAKSKSLDHIGQNFYWLAKGLYAS